MQSLGNSLEEDAGDTERVCLEAAERILDRVLGDGGAERSEAADLLAADALVTYALEFAAETPGEFADSATRAIERFARLRADEP